MSKREPARHSGPREENGKCKEPLSHKTSRKLAQPRPLDPEHTMVSVYDGQHRLGTVACRRQVFEAIDVHGRSIGKFVSQAAASRALPDRGAP